MDETESGGSGRMRLRRLSREGSICMTVERGLRVAARTFTLISLALGHWVNPYWYLFTAFVGLNLFQSGFTNWCPMMTFVRKLGMDKEGEQKHA